MYPGSFGHASAIRAIDLSPSDVESPVQALVVTCPRFLNQAL